MSTEYTNVKLLIKWLNLFIPIYLGCVIDKKCNFKLNLRNELFVIAFLNNCKVSNCKEFLKKIKNKKHNFKG